MARLVASTPLTSSRPIRPVATPPDPAQPRPRTHWPLPRGSGRAGPGTSAGCGRGWPPPAWSSAAKLRPRCRGSARRGPRPCTMINTNPRQRRDGGRACSVRVSVCVGRRRGGGWVPDTMCGEEEGGRGPFAVQQRDGRHPGRRLLGVAQPGVEEHPGRRALQQLCGGGRRQGEGTVVGVSHPKGRGWAIPRARRLSHPKGRGWAIPRARRLRRHLLFSA